MKKSYEKLLDNNKKWVTEQLELDPNFFENLSKGQSPEYLWIAVPTAGFQLTPSLELTLVKCLYIETLPIWWYIVT